MSETTLTPDSSTPDNSERAELAKWVSIEAFKDELTRQRDRLAHAHRKYEAGKGAELDPARELESVQEALRKAMPTLAPAPDGAPTDMLAGELIASYWDTVKLRKNTASTGLTGLNDILSGGLEAGRLMVILGAPNTGKTTFTHQLADHVACSGRPVLYVTSEDTPSALFAKTLARVGGISYTAVLKGWRERAGQN